MKQHIFSVIVENQSGVLARVVGLFSARGYNIDSLSVNHTENDDRSIITLVVTGDDRVIEQVTKQLNKVIDVIKITEHTKENSFQRELAIFKLNCSATKRVEIFQIAQTFNAEILNISKKCITLSVIGDPEKIDTLIEIVTSYGIIESVRTGRISINKKD